MKNTKLNENILNALIDDYIDSTCGEFTDCEGCVLCHNVENDCDCPVAEYDGYEYFHGSSKKCKPEILNQLFKG